MTPLPRPLIGLALPILGAALLAGCRCERSDAPYTPFGVASALPYPPGLASGSALPQPSTSSSAAPLPTFESKAAQRAPANQTQWAVDGVSMTAPPDHTIVLALTAQLDRDDALDGVAWAQPKQGVGGELWFFPGVGTPKRLTGFPDFLPTGRCQLGATLHQTGPSSVSLDLVSECEGSVVERSPQRALLVLNPAREQPVLVTLRAALPAPGEELLLAVNSRDRDDDGRDDLRVVVTLKAGDGVASAALAWLDRAAGEARDPSEPSNSLTAGVSAEVGRSRNKKNAAQVLANLKASARLYASLCAESGTPRIFDSEGLPLSCGKLERFVDDHALAELQVALAQGKVLEAAGVLGREAWLHHALSKGRREQMVKALEKACSLVSASEVKPLSGELAKRPPPHFGVLSFEQAEPTLLLRGESGLLRASADGSAVAPVPETEALRPWPLEVALPDGSRLDSATHACGRSEASLVFVSSAGQMRYQPLPQLLAARPGPCGSRPTQGVPAVSPLAVVGDQVAAWVAGTRVGPEPIPAVQGTPRSPDGKLTVLPTPIGLLVDGTAKPELWRHPDLPTPATLMTDCTVANAARAVACVSQGKAVLVVR